MVSNNSKSSNKANESAKVTRFTLKKLPIGLASVALGATMYAGATTASADTVNSAAAPAPVEETDMNATLPGTPASEASQATATPTVKNVESTSNTPTADQADTSSATSQVVSTSSTTSLDSATASNANEPSTASNAAASNSQPSTASSAAASNSQSSTALDKASDVTLTYYVHDDDNDGKVVYKGTQAMKPGQKFTYSEFKLPDNYELVGDGNGNIGSEDYKVDIHAKHRVVTLTASKSVPIERTITIHYPDNSVKTITQTGSYQSPASELDEVTNTAKSVGKPTLTGINAYQVPEVEGYTPNIKEVPALTAEAYDAGAKLMVNISYAKNGANPNSANNNSGSNASSSAESSTNSGSASSSSTNSSAATPGSNANSASDNPGSQNNSSSSAAENGSTSNASSTASAAENGSTSNASSTASAASDQSSVVNDSTAQNAKETSTTTDDLTNTQAAPAVATTAYEGNTGSLESLATQSNGTDASVNSMNSDSTIDSATGNDSESLPQTGNDVSEELAALGLGTLGVVGTAALGMRKKKY